MLDEIKQDTIGDILKSEHEMSLYGGEKYGEFFVHVTEDNYRDIKNNGFDGKREIWTLDLGDMNSLGVSNKYSQDRFSRGTDPGHININLPQGVYDDLLKNNLVIERPQNSTFGLYNEIVFKPEASDIINK